MIRPVTYEDIDWVFAAGGAYYKDVVEEDAKEELRSILNSKNSLFIRSDTAVFAGKIGRYPYNKKIVIVEDCFFFGKGIVALMEFAIAWAKENGATDFNFCLGYESSVRTLKPLAKKLGAKPVYVELYNIKLV